MIPFRVKICGIRSLADAEAVLEAGADAIGFNFWPKSRRHLPLREAVALARQLPPSLVRVGVFVDPSAEEVQAALDSGAISLAQFHGDEPDAFCRQFDGRYFKALRLKDEHALSQLSDFRAPLLLIDAVTAGYGGSGQRADVELARRAAALRPILLAGGLTPENVEEAILTVRPFGVDVAGGVERPSGEKDPARVIAFVARARAALDGDPGELGAKSNGKVSA